ncbi:MAG: Deoxyribodipyrimidine photo-lyase [Candidatus Celerinatantimonas neptuna]|nr:MAG: Deoxyribodipyrimidine photo-lyase [Candidatus Celerinatantimonas neptuna]
MSVLVWLRHELRTCDNPLFLQAAQYHTPIYTCYCVTEKQWKKQHHSQARNQFVLNRLIDMRQELHTLNIPLLVFNCETYQGCIDTILSTVKKIQANVILIGEEYGLWERQRDAEIEEKLHKQGCTLKKITSQLLVAPNTLMTRQNKPYRVFTPFAKAWHKQIATLSQQYISEPYDNLESISCDEGLTDDQLRQLANGKSRWPTSEKKILNHLELFIRDKVSHYLLQRDFPAKSATSCLSPAFAHGICSVQQALTLLQKYHPEDLMPKTGASCWLNELIWREFYIHLLAQFDSISQGLAFKPQTRHIKWHDNPQHLYAWQQGKTGIPIVDAGMRQLNMTGWMHNRVRMITASFLCKNLWLDWKSGERYFMNNLVDGHLANNNGGWQWSSSTGTDSVPYFRVFNPITQSQKFDPNGDYIRQWIPELSILDSQSIHQPTESERKKIGYPLPIVDLKTSRDKAIQEFARQTTTREKTSPAI